MIYFLPKCYKKIRKRDGVQLPGFENSGLNSVSMSSAFPKSLAIINIAHLKNICAHSLLHYNFNTTLPPSCWDTCKRIHYNCQRTFHHFDMDYWHTH